MVLGFLACATVPSCFSRLLSVVSSFFSPNRAVNELRHVRQELGGIGEAVHRVEERRLNYSFLLIDI